MLLKFSSYAFWVCLVWGGSGRQRNDVFKSVWSRRPEAVARVFSGLLRNRELQWIACERIWAQGEYGVFPAAALPSLVDKCREDCCFMKGAPAINKPAHLTENVSSEECAGTWGKVSPSNSNQSKGIQDNPSKPKSPKCMMLLLWTGMCANAPTSSLHRFDSPQILQLLRILLSSRPHLARCGVLCSSGVWHEILLKWHFRISSGHLCCKQFCQSDCPLSRSLLRLQPNTSTTACHPLADISDPIRPSQNLSNVLEGQLWDVDNHIFGDVDYLPSPGSAGHFTGDATAVARCCQSIAISWHFPWFPDILHCIYSVLYTERGQVWNWQQHCVALAGDCKRCCFHPKGRCSNGYECRRRQLRQLQLFSAYRISDISVIAEP